MRWLLTLVGVSLGAIAQAQPYPAKPIHIIIPYAAGGGPDIQVRQFGQKLSEAIRQPVILENKVGAAGVLAAQYVMQQPADGYTFLLGSNTHLIQKHLNPALKFDPVSDFAPVSNMSTTPCVLVVRADHPARTVQDLVAMAKKNPGKLNYGSGGIGTSAHLAGATLQAVAGLKTVHIPLKGSVEIAPSLLRGDTDFAFPVSSTGMPQVKAGKLRALAVTSTSRLQELPDIPTLNEALKNDLYVQESWFGLWAPARTPAAQLHTMHAAASKVLSDPWLERQFAAQGSAIAKSESPEAFAAFVRSENEKWAQIVRLTAAKAD